MAGDPLTHGVVVSNGQGLLITAFLVADGLWGGQP